MRRFCDSASVPTATALAIARKYGVTGWAGYLASPYAARAWRPEELTRVLAEVGALLPIYVGPYPKGVPTPDSIRAALAAASPSNDALRLVESLHSIGGRGYPPRQPVAVDIEANVWIASPSGVIQYLSQLVAAVARLTRDVELFPYSSPTCLEGLHRLGFNHAWAASWLRSTKWPTTVAPPNLGDLWAGRRAWQYHGNTGAYGMRLDLNVADDAFPFVLHRAPAPAPKPPAPAPKPPAPPAATKYADATIVVNGTTYRGRLTAP